MNCQTPEIVHQTSAHKMLDLSQYVRERALGLRNKLEEKLRPVTMPIQTTTNCAVSSGEEQWPELFNAERENLKSILSSIDDIEYILANVDI